MYSNLWIAEHLLHHRTRQHACQALHAPYSRGSTGHTTGAGWSQAVVVVRLSIRRFTPPPSKLHRRAISTAPSCDGLAAGRCIPESTDLRVADDLLHHGVRHSLLHHPSHGRRHGPQAYPSHSVRVIAGGVTSMGLAGGHADLGRTRQGPLASAVEDSLGRATQPTGSLACSMRQPAPQEVLRPVRHFYATPTDAVSARDWDSQMAEPGTADDVQDMYARSGSRQH